MRVRRTDRIRRLVALSSLVALATMSLSVVPAQATTSSVACSGTNSVQYTPPPTNQPQNVTADIDLDWNPCVSSEPGLTSGGMTTLLPLGNRSCAQLLGTSILTHTITWNTGQTTTHTGTYIVTIVGGVLTTTAVGTVTAGLFKGHAVTSTYTGPAVDILLCTAGLGTVSTMEQIATLVIAPV